MSAPDASSPRYFAWLYSPPLERQVLESLYGIEREISESLRPGIDHQVAHSRLQWWREECERAANGAPVHPLTRNLRAATDQLSGLTGFVDTAIWDLAGAAFDTRKELTAYCERWADAMIEPVLSVAARKSSWRGLGAALREIEMLTHLARDATRGRLRVPMDELDEVGADPAVLANLPWPPAVAALLGERFAQLCLELTRCASTFVPEAQLPSRGLLVWATLSSRRAREASRALPGPSHPARIGAVADNWVAWRAARRATAGRFS
jgi:phytoene synthase